MGINIPQRNYFNQVVFQRLNGPDSRIIIECRNIQSATDLSLQRISNLHLHLSPNLSSPSDDYSIQNLNPRQDVTHHTITSLLHYTPTYHLTQSLGSHSPLDLTLPRITQSLGSNNPGSVHSPVDHYYYHFATKSFLLDLLPPE